MTTDPTAARLARVKELAAKCRPWTVNTENGEVRSADDQLVARVFPLYETFLISALDPAFVLELCDMAERCAAAEQDADGMAATQCEEPEAHPNGNMICGTVRRLEARIAELEGRLETAVRWLRRLELEYPGCINHDAIDKHLADRIASGPAPAAKE